MNKTPKQLAAEYIAKLNDTHSVKVAIEKGFLEGYFYGYLNRQKKEKNASTLFGFTIKDVLGMTIEEYLHKHSEEIAEEVMKNNPLWKETKDE
jgi:hypothetical protein